MEAVQPGRSGPIHNSATFLPQSTGRGMWRRELRKDLRRQDDTFLITIYFLSRTQTGFPLVLILGRVARKADAGTGHVSSGLGLAIRALGAITGGDFDGAKTSPDDNTLRSRVAGSGRARKCSFAAMPLAIS